MARSKKINYRLITFVFPSMIYLDNSATTQLDPHVHEAMLPYLAEKFGNASSIYSLGREARMALEDARSLIALTIGADSAEIVFTSGGTEANNHAIKGAIFETRKEGKWFEELSIVTSQAEHHAVLEPIAFMESLGVKVNRVGVDSNGLIQTESIKENASLASFMLVNNEVGAVNSIKEISRAVHSLSKDTLIHSDAVQALGKIDIDVKDIGVDLLSLSAHKIHGPKGIGALFIRRGIKIELLHHGGSQERNRRGGTESVALAVGFGEAIRQMQLKKDESRKHLKTLREFAITKLSAMPEVLFNSPIDENGVDGIINISFIPDALKKLDGEALLIRFDLEGIAVSNGSACTSGSIQPSHVLLAMGKGEEIASKSLRISFSRFTRIDEIEKFVAMLSRIIQGT
jgi:cysteine desulfurase